MCNKCTSCKIYVKRNSSAALKTLERQRTVVGMLFNFFAITSELEKEKQENLELCVRSITAGPSEADFN